MSSGVSDHDPLVALSEDVPVSPLSALGSFLGVVIATRVAVASPPSQALAESAVPLVAAVAVVLVDRWLVGRAVSIRDRVTVFSFGLGGFLAAALLTALHLHVLALSGVGPPDPLYLSLLSGTMGVAAGTVAGVAVIRQQDASREARRQRRRLETFTSVVSHDLRNPLTVAMGQLHETVRTGDASHLEAVHDALCRMDELVDDSLSLARSGSQVVDPEPAPLVELAAESWEYVDTGGATLELDGTRQLLADRRRLRRLFENCYRNACEHGGADTIRVGPLSDGFYIEDDGAGIPADLRAEVFTQGVSTAPDGSGLGLAIVEAVAQAHGWVASATQSSDGGARFEFRRE